MLVERGVDLPVEVVQQRDRAPELFVLTEAPRVGAHGGLDGQRVTAQRLALRVARQRVPGSFAGDFHLTR